MIEFIKSIIGYTATLIGLVAIVTTIVNYADVFSNLWSLILKVFNLKAAISKRYYGSKRKKYYKALCEDKFIKWQNNTLKTVYEQMVKDDAKVKFTDLTISNDTKIASFNYEAITIKLEPVSYPFDNICPKELLSVKNDVEDDKYFSDFYDSFKKECKKYYKMLRDTIRYPDRIGYMLDELVIEEDGKWHIKSYVDDYENNIKTSHILEYELFNLYKRTNGKVFEDREELLRLLPIRNYIHSKIDEKHFFRYGKGRASLLSVQMLVLVKNYSGSYDAL